MQITIFTTKEDIASMTIRKALLETYNFVEEEDVKDWNRKVFTKFHRYSVKQGEEGTDERESLEFFMVLTDVRAIRLDEVLQPHELYGDFVVFASRHSSTSGQPALLAHTPGNWNDDISAGGSPNKIAYGSGLMLYYFNKYLTHYSKERNFEFPVGQEVTHHGPTNFLVPLTFIELGSTEKEWKNEEGAQIVADTIISAGKEIYKNHYKNGSIVKKDIKVCIGFGGTHYMPNLSKLIPLGYSFVHTVPKYKILDLNEALIQQMIEKSVEEIDYWVLDWKGLNSKEKQHLMALLQKTEIPIKKSKELKNRS